MGLMLSNVLSLGCVVRTWRCTTWSCHLCLAQLLGFIMFIVMLFVRSAAVSRSAVDVSYTSVLRRLVTLVIHNLGAIQGFPASLHRFQTYWLTRL